MNEALVIFGNGQMAELAVARFRRNETLRIVAFTVDRAVLTASRLHDLPVVPFDELVAAYPPDAVRLFVAIGPVQVNRIRADRCAQAKRLGYTLVSWVSRHAIIDTAVQIGENCSIGDGVVIGPHTLLGDGVFIASGSVIGHHCVLENNCFIGSNCSVNGSVRVGERALLGSGSVIRDNVDIGAACVVGIGAAIVRDTAPASVFVAPEAVQLPIDSSRMRL